MLGSPHPIFDAFMSLEDIFQLYWLRKQDYHSFGIVLSPRRNGVKALCVHLTDNGFEMMKNYEACAKEDFKEYAVSRIESSMQTFYCQIPFQMSNVLRCGLA